MKKALVLGAVVLAAAGGLWFESHKGQMGGGYPSGPSIVEVKAQTVKAESIDLTQDLSGRTQAFYVAEIRPQVGGIIVSRLFEEGGTVTRGQQLYQIDPAPYQAAYDSAAADLQKAEANVKSIQGKQARYAELVKVGGVSKQDYEDAVAAYEQAKADVAIANAAVATAKINLDYTKVFSPISGRIGKSSVTEGALVTANQGEALAVVQQLDKVYVDVTQSVGEARKLRQTIDGSAPALATLTVEGETEPYSEKGTVQFADVTVDQGTGTVQLRILFENPKAELLPGMFVKARVVQSHKEGALLVPQRAVTRNADGTTTIWCLDGEGKAQMRPLTLGQVVGDRWLVQSGLSDGDRIVVEGGQKITPDATIKVVDVSGGTPDAAPKQ